MLFTSRVVSITITTGESAQLFSEHVKLSLFFHDLRCLFVRPFRFSFADYISRPLPLLLSLSWRSKNPDICAYWIWIIATAQEPKKASGHREGDVVYQFVFPTYHVLLQINLCAHKHKKEKKKAKKGADEPKVWGVKRIWLDDEEKLTDGRADK